MSGKARYHGIARRTFSRCKKVIDVINVFYYVVVINVIRRKGEKKISRTFLFINYSLE